MITADEARARVARGVAALDSYGPADWRARITRPVRVATTTDCPLGQVYGDYNSADAREFLGRIGGVGAHRWTAPAVAAGFSHEPGEAPAVDEAWRDALTAPAPDAVDTSATDATTLRARVAELERLRARDAQRHAAVLDSIREAAIEKYRDGGAICESGLRAFLSEYGMAPMVTTRTVTFEVVFTVTSDSDEDAENLATAELREMRSRLDVSGVEWEWESTDDVDD